MRLGVCYYPEHWPEARWATDAEMMRAAGLDLVRLAEFAWAEMEPAEGQFQWAWLDRAIDTLAQQGLAIVLGTPTAAPPAWLTHAYPDILRRDAAGRVRTHGTRRHYCPNSPRYRHFSRLITTALATRYGQDARVIGWQVDNEFGGGKTARCYCDQCAAAFRRWLQARYGSLAELNAAWGNVFWSQTYTAWAQIPPPDKRIDKRSPSHELDYYRFCSASYAAYQQEQIDILRRLAPGQFVTTNFMGLYTDLDQFALAEPYDFITWDSYPTGNRDRWQSFLRSPVGDGPGAPYAYDAGDPLITGLAHELTRALKQQPFWIMEQQPGYINWGQNNPQARERTVRLWTWHALAAGADTVVYFRWRPTRFAHEQYHAGLLRHDGAPAVGYRDLLALQDERDLMAKIAAAPQAAEVALLCDYDDVWALQLQPHAPQFSYFGLLYVYFQALHRLGIPVHIVRAGDDFRRYKLVIAPTAHLIDPALVAACTAYVQDGGSLLLGIRSGFKTPSNLVTDQPLPGAFRPLVGGTVEEWQALPAGIAWDINSDIPGLDHPAGYWVEALRPDTARPLAHYAHGPAALLAHPVGRGQVYYLGFYPHLDQATALLAHLARPLALAVIAGLPPGVVAYGRGPYTILLNFTDQELRAVVTGESITIPGRDIHVHHTAEPGR